MLSDPGSQEHFTIIRHWLSNCREQHTLCRTATSKFTPHRLIDVGHSEQLKLVESVPSAGVNDHDLSDQYVTLSYCWGDGVFSYVTTPENVEERKNNFSETILPAVIRDAIRITRTVGLRYLWVDALCILQGDSSVARADWSRESNFMQEVFDGFDAHRYPHESVIDAQLVSGLLQKRRVSHE